MGGMYSDSRVPMPGKSRYALSSGGLNTSPSSKDWHKTVKKDGNVFNDRTRAQLLDTVYSYRSNRSDDTTMIQDLLDASRKDNPILKGDTGHEFDATRRYVKNVVSPYVNVRLAWNNSAGSMVSAYKGPVGIWTPETASQGTLSFSGLGGYGWYPLALDTSWNSTVMGQKAIVGCAPARAKAGLAAALLELREGFPRMIGSALKKKVGNRPHQAIGDEFLNWIFGWVPTLSDIQSVAKSMVNADKIINQYSRDTDRLVRRTYKFPSEIDTKFGTETITSGKRIPITLTPGGFDGWSDAYPYGSIGYDFKTEDGSSPSISLVQKTTYKTWFSGAFRYHLETGDDLFSRMDRTAQIAAKWLGARADISAFWQVMPWSWFIDWFIDIGDLITSANNALLDGQVLQYGYIMRTSTIERTFQTDQPLWLHNGGSKIRVGHLSTTFVSQRKRRVRATPFGFGLNPNSFTVQQWAVLGALGLTRAPGKLQ